MNKKVNDRKAALIGPSSDLVQGKADNEAIKGIQFALIGLLAK